MDQGTDVFHGLPILTRRNSPTSSDEPPKQIYAPCTTQAVTPTAINAAEENSATIDATHHTHPSEPSPVGPEGGASQDETISDTAQLQLQQRMEGMWPSQQQAYDDVGDPEGRQSASSPLPDDTVLENKAAVLRGDWPAAGTENFAAAQPFLWKGFLPQSSSEQQQLPLYPADHFALAPTEDTPGYSGYDPRAYNYNNLLLRDIDLPERKPTFTETDDRHFYMSPSDPNPPWSSNQLYYNNPRTTLSPCTNTLVYPRTHREDTIALLEAGDLEMDELWWPDDAAAGSASPPATGSAGSKVDEPYAQLIYRAFMSKPNKSMTLQEIYQWFRENTDKAKSEGKGWQNSIRHNLSMNLAFTKRNSKAGLLNSDGTIPMEPATSGVDGRKSTEWFLEPEFYSGVESTTRYRKGNGNSRSRGPASQHRSTGRISGGGGNGPASSTRDNAAYSDARVSAGRKGGNVAAQNRRRQAEKQQRAAAMRNDPRMQLHHGYPPVHHRPRQQQGSFPTPPSLAYPPQPQYLYSQQQQQVLPGHLDINYNFRAADLGVAVNSPDAASSEPTTPPDMMTHVGEMGSKFPSPPQASQSEYLANPLGGGGGYSRQNYTMEDVAGAFEAPNGIAPPVFVDHDAPHLSAEEAALFGMFGR